MTSARGSRETKREAAMGKREREKRGKRRREKNQFFIFFIPSSLPSLKYKSYLNRLMNTP
jgi:hypothetical protein